jgi:tape measure domain-containing protein
MAMTLDTAIKFTAKLEGTGLDQLKRGLQGMAQQANRTSKDLDQLYAANKKLSTAAGTSISSLQRQVTVMTSLRNEAEIGSRQFKLYSAELEKLKRQQAQLAGAASGSGGVSGLMAVGGSFKALGGLALGAGILQLGRGIASAGMEAETAQVRLKALTSQYGEYNRAVEITDRIQKTLRLSTAEAQDGFAKLYAGLRPTGVTMKEMEAIFVGFSAAARVSGATAQETSNAMVQLKQSLVSGRAQGDELRSILEQAPALGQAVAEQMTKLGTFGKVTRAQLKDLGADGKISTDVLIAALKQLGETELPKLANQFNTGQQAVTDFQNATKDLFTEISKLFGPTVVKGLQLLTDLLKGVADSLKGANVRIDAAQQARQQTRKELLEKYNLGDGGMGSFFKLLVNPEAQRFEQRRFEELYQQNLKSKQDAPTPEQLKAQEQADKEREAGRAAADREAMEKAKKNLADQLKIREDMEKRLADFREQSIQRAADLERQLGDQRMELERSTEEARRRVREQQQDFALEAERQRLRGAGLSTDALDTQARLNEATRRFTEQKIQIEQNATDRKVQLERTLEDYKLNVARGIRDILVDGAEKMAAKMREGARGAAGAMGAPMASGGIIARTGSTGQSTGPHLDARWADGRPISAADADRYLSVNGRSPSSYGVTSGYGPRSLFGRSFHRGIDFGTPSGSGVSLKGGASLLRDLGFTGAGGYAVEIDTPEGRMRLLHLQGGSAARPVGSARQLIGRPGAAAAAASGVDLSGIDAAGKRLDAASGANRSASLAAAAGELVNSRQAELGTITSQLDQQRKSVREQREDFERMLELQRSGLTPELARQVAERERMARTEDASLQKLRDQLTLDLQGNDLTQQQRIAVEKILADTILRQQALQGVVEGLNTEEQALSRLQQAYEQKRQLVEGIANSIGNGIGSAIDLLIDGTDNWGDSLRQIAAGVLKDIARQIAQTMVVAPIVKGITSAFGFANGGIMTGDGPMPLRKYAAGGIANSPQLAMFGEGSMPEAYVPLPDGRRIPVAMKGGGSGTNVIVNVDATGSQVQGNSGQGEQLGRAISQAVQNELVRQKRPGGLLAA